MRASVRGARAYSRWLVLIGVALGGAACAPERRERRERRPMAEEGEPCAAVQREVEAVLAQVPERCEHDGDCACLPREIACARVTDRRHAARLRTLARLRALARCPAPLSRCPPRGCTPRCVHGSCVNTATARRSTGRSRGRPRGALLERPAMKGVAMSSATSPVCDQGAGA
ncbi:MAG: hypothetical protein IPG96_20290 [Proteobacteria bacterium]|nr:hypothetical protein [Pseudomonadota bacterium]